MVTLADIKIHLHIDADLTVEDALLDAYVGAAIEHIEKITEEDFSVNMPLAIQHAVKLLVGHWYRNREGVSEGKQTEAPFTINALIEPYRKHTI